MQQQAGLLSALTCAGLARLAVGLRLIVPLLVLETHQVRVGLRAEPGSDADHVLVGCIQHLLHLETHSQSLRAACFTFHVLWKGSFHFNLILDFTRQRGTLLFG